MYTYERAVGVYLTGPKGEQLLDISKYALKTIPKYFRSMIVVIYDELYAREVSLNLFDYYDEISVYNDTIQPWLDTKANVVLKTSNTVPGDEYRYVTLHDIQYEWFSLLPGDAEKAHDTQDKMNSTEAPDIRIHKTNNSNVDYPKLGESCLWTINGHLVKAVTDSDYVYLLNAGKHFNVNDNIHVTALNFNTISTMTTNFIGSDDIEFIDGDTYHQLHLKTNYSLNNKVVWMSIGGRLYLDDIIQVVGNNTIKVNIDKVDWFSRIFESKRYIDLTSVIDEEREVVGSDFFMNEDFFTSLFTDKSTFIIVMDNVNMSVEVIPTVTYQYPYTYHTEETMLLPLMLSTGLLPKYFVRQIINRRLLDIDLGVQRLFLNETTGVGNGGNLYHGWTNRHHPSKLNNGYLLKIRSVVQKQES